MGLNTPKYILMYIIIKRTMTTMPINKIKDMTFEELREELVNSRNNPTKELLIRKLMLQKWNENLVKKKQIREQKIIEKQKRIEKLKEKIKKKVESEINKNNKIKKDNEEDNVEIKEEEKLLNELMDDVKDFNIEETNKEREYTKYERDHLNNNLINRMESEFNLRKIKNEKSFIPPYSDDAGENYAKFVSKKSENKIKSFYH
jgi:hypothetical protein